MRKALIAAIGCTLAVAGFSANVAANPPEHPVEHPVEHPDGHPAGDHHEDPAHPEKPHG